ncbi:MAG: hypothetical protein DRJ40_03520 [Thermoprotei archaeon]|nr:MAG: hypothetical protein DRJ40_03520 [Thermoprotei archaeon]
MYLSMSDVRELLKDLSTKVLNSVSRGEVGDVVELVDLLIECYIASLLLNDMELRSKVVNVLKQLTATYSDVVNPYLKLLQGTEYIPRYHVPYFKYMLKLLSGEEVVSEEIATALLNTYCEVMTMLSKGTLDTATLRTLLTELLSLEPREVGDLFLLSDAVAEIYYLLSSIEAGYEVDIEKEKLFVLNRALLLGKYVRQRAKSPKQSPNTTQ